MIIMRYWNKLKQYNKTVVNHTIEVFHFEIRKYSEQIKYFSPDKNNGQDETSIRVSHARSQVSAKSVSTGSCFRCWLLSAIDIQEPNPFRGVNRN